MSPDDVFPASFPMPAAHDAFMAVATEKMSGFRERAHLRRLERNGPLARSATRRAYSQFAEEGGEEGTGMKFLDWLVANWDSILKMIMSIIGLFGGVPAMGMSNELPAAAAAFPQFPPVDVGTVTAIAEGVENLRKAFDDLMATISTVNLPWPVGK